MASTETAAAKKREIQKLVASRGWSILKEVMEREIVEAAMAIAQSPSMSLDEINYRRGAIWAGKSLVELPERLLIRLEGEILLESTTTKKSDPAKAGQEE